MQLLFWLLAVPRLIVRVPRKFPEVNQRSPRFLRTTAAVFDKDQLSGTPFSASIYETGFPTMVYALIQQFITNSDFDFKYWLLHLVLTNGRAYLEHYDNLIICQLS